jgi:purine catabolism regulator
VAASSSAWAAPPLRLPTFPLVEIPWEVRFSDVTRAVVQHLLAQRHAGGSDAGRAQFMSVVLDGRGFRGVAAVLDAALSRAVVILDHEFRPQAFGHKALVSLGDSGVTDCRRAGDELSQEDVDQLGLLFSEESPGPVPELVPLGLGPGLGLAVTARSRVVAYLHAFEYGDSNAGAPDLDAMRLREAAEAVAMESVRRQAAAEAEARIRGHFLWGLATGSIDPMSDVANEASLLGYSPRAHYHVALLDVSEGDPAAVERRLLREGQHRQLRVHSARQGSRVLLLIGAVTDGESPAPDPMDRLLRVGGADSKSGATVAAGMALGCWQLTELATAYHDAERTLRVAQTVHGAHAIASANDLGPFLLLSRVAEDQQAREIARHALQPLLDYSRKRSPRLAETLDVYFEEDGNVSRTAKRLYLSRHSLLYRLEMIERLTGFSVRNRYDRLLLELSLTLLRLGVLETPTLSAPRPGVSPIAR